MRAIILAAGRGTRLGGIAGDDPKCLMRIGNVTLLERQLATLGGSGISRVTVVTGHRAERVAAVCGTMADTIENTRHAESNSLYSLWLARDLLEDGFLVLNADVLFHPQLLDDLVSCRYEDALLVAFRQAGAEPYGDEEMKVKVRAGRVSDIAKTLGAGDADAENVGMAKFGAEGARVLIEQMDRIVAAGGLRDWAPAAFLEFARVRPLHAIGTRGFPWIEIDFPEDYRRAVRDVLPQIEAAALTENPLSLSPLPVRREPAGAEWRPHPSHV